MILFTIRRARRVAIALAGALMCCASTAHAEFAVTVSPPRFELETMPGRVTRQTIELSNASSEPVRLSIRTADWVYQPSGTVDIFEDLQPGSCRPWVALERREVLLKPGQPFRFRFEVAPPAETTPIECRFAILVEGKDDSIAKSGDLGIPYTGRLACVVYVGVGGVRAELAVVGSEVRPVNGEPTAALLVKNTGAAHDRLRGLLTGKDADGTALDLTPSGDPILPGETRAVPILATRHSDPSTRFSPRLPIEVSGRIEWGKRQGTQIDLRIPQ